MNEVDPSTPVIIVKGDDDVLLDEQVSRIVGAMVGEEDRSLVLDEFGIDDLALEEGGYSLTTVLDALETPPFLTERRVLLVRHAGVFSTKDAVAPLVAHLADQLPTNSLVLVWEKDPRPGRAARNSAVPKSLLDAVAAAGGAVLDASPGRRSDAFIDDRLSDGSLRFDAAARRLLVDHLGNDVGRLPSILETLESVFGPGAKVSSTDIEPYLGDSGDVAPWDLTDAIDVGDGERALAVLDRMLVGGGRHPLQVLATLTTHYLRIARVDDPGIGGEKQAADALGIKGSTFPAKKALDASRRLGSDRITEILDLLAQADLDLRGARAWPPELVAEVLVARLASRSRAAGGKRSGGASNRRAAGGRGRR